jgi:exodeoxyribonuclease-3
MAACRPVRIATWNLNGARARLPRLLEWLGAAQPDVLAIQETKCTDADFPAAELGELGYAVAHHGTGGFSGVGVLSRIGIADTVIGFAADGDAAEDSAAEAVGESAEGALPGMPVTDKYAEPRIITALCGPVRVVSVYVPNGRALDSPEYPYKLRWFARLQRHVAEVARPAQPVVVTGDFNVALTDDDVWDRAAFDGSTHVTEPERDGVRALLAWGLTDVVPRPLKYDKPFTYWDYRAGMFHKNMGMRIDYVLASEPVASAVTDAYVDRDARKGKLPSDHAPIVVDVDLDT